MTYLQKSGCHLGARRTSRIQFSCGIFLDESILICNTDSGENANYKWNSFDIGNEGEGETACR